MFLKFYCSICIDLEYINCPCLRCWNNGLVTVGKKNKRTSRIIYLLLIWVTKYRFIVVKVFLWWDIYEEEKTRGNQDFYDPSFGVDHVLKCLKMFKKNLWTTHMSLGRFFKMQRNLQVQIVWSLQSCHDVDIQFNSEHGVSNVFIIQMIIS